jgi:hypothetical protein
MSRNEWERGEIKLSTKEFGPVRRDLIASYNARQSRLFNHAQHLYVNLKELGKGKRGYDYHASLENMLTNGSMRQYIGDVDGGYEITDAIFPNEKKEIEGKGFTWQRSRKPKAPKKSQFAPLKQSATVIPVGNEAGIGFKKDLRLVIWQVSENNHSVERARSNAMGREFFNRLNRVVWTRGTGGEIVGNDEYNQDSRESGGGSNYVTARYGVAEKQFKSQFVGRR